MNTLLFNPYYIFLGMPDSLKSLKIKEVSAVLLLIIIIAYLVFNAGKDVNIKPVKNNNTTGNRFYSSLPTTSTSQQVIFGKTSRDKDSTFIEITIEGKKLRLMDADTPEKMERGLTSYREFPADGMIFRYSTRRLQSYWNNNAFFDFDVYWVNGSDIIGKAFLPSVEKNGIVTVKSPSVVDTVILVIKH